MPSIRDLFLAHVGQTSDFPLTIEVDRAEGIFIYDTKGQRYFDLDSGFSVSSLGHRHPEVVKAVQRQMDRYWHTTVYGEHIQNPQVGFAALLSSTLNNGLDTVYYTTGGSEAVEVALKAAKKYTGRYEIISCAKAYHGSTLAAESLRSDTKFLQRFMPGVPGVQHIRFNHPNDFDKITTKTAAVILEAVQAEAGIISPENNYLSLLQEKCRTTGTLLIIDEIQTGFGRTGHLFAFQQYDIVPDIFVIGKAMGAGMPIGAMVSTKTISRSLTVDPMLGHINTFGGHPVSAAAALANLEVLTQSDIIQAVAIKEKLFKTCLQHPLIQTIRSNGLFMAVDLGDKDLVSKAVPLLLQHGVITDFFLFNHEAFRISPPLIISEAEIKEVCNIILKVLEKVAAGA